MTNDKAQMPDEGWVSDNDTCIFFDNEEDARLIAHGNLTKYTRSDLATKPQQEVEDAIAFIQRGYPTQYSGNDHSEKYHAAIKTLITAAQHKPPVSDDVVEALKGLLEWYPIKFSSHNPEGQTPQEKSYWKAIKIVSGEGV